MKSSPCSIASLCVVLSLRHFGPAAMLLIIPWRGWAPRILARCCSIGASRRFFYLANSAAGRSMALVLFELPGGCTSAPAASERNYLVAIRGDDGAWAVTDAADGGIADRGGGRGSYRVIEINAGQILQRAHSSTSCSRFDISGWRDGVLYPFARGRRRRRRRLGRGASRPARAAWVVQRLLTADGDVAGSAEFQFRDIRKLGAIGIQAVWLAQRLLTADGDVAGSANSIFAIFGVSTDTGARASLRRPLAKG